MAIQVTTEERMRLKTRARQRLLGAVVLLIATAIILPLLLDKSPRSLNSDVVIDMPERKAASAKPPIQAATDMPAGKTQAPVAVPPSNKISSLALPVKPVSAATPASPDSAVKQVPSGAVERKKPENTTKIQKKNPDSGKSKPGRSAVVSSVNVQHAKSPADEKPAASSKPANDHTRYVVQLGAFSSAANVRQLCDRLKKAGVATYTEILPSGSTRVRAGPFPNYALADKTLAKISMAGIQAQIVPLSH